MTAEEEKNVGQEPVSTEGEDVTLKKDGGVLKVIKKEGSGTETPMTGDKVFVHYTGELLDGTVFDSSRDRNDKFSFELGKGQVIQAWDIAVATMKIGEVCQITCKPEYAYGASGSPPKIPPNATLIFEIELFDFKGEDLTDDENGGIIRRIRKKGESYAKPNEGSLVEIHLEGKCNGKVFDDRDVTFELGDCESFDIPHGIETVVKQMERGEESLVLLKSKYGFRSEGNAKLGIPPNADLQYEVTLKSFEKAKESWEMSTEEKLEQGSIVKEKGTQYFKEGKYKQAVVQYKKIVQWLEHETGLLGDEDSKAKALRLAAHLNLAACYLKMKEFVLAGESCDKALELDSNSEKALFRHGEAMLGVNEVEQARADFQKVLQLYPSNKAARTQIAVCQKKLKEQHEKDKKIYGNMFQKFAERDAKLEALKPKVGSKVEEEKKESQITDRGDDHTTEVDSNEDPMQITEQNGLND